MINSVIRPLIFATVLVVTGQLSAIAQEINVSLAEGPVTSGSTLRGTIRLSIPEGLHVNSNKPSSEYLIATTVRLSGEGVKIGKIDYPEGQNRKFQFSDRELNVYEGEIAIPFSVSILKSFKRKPISMKALVSYQACTEEVCYPPKKKEIVITAPAK
jgi:hypothetical protein